MTQPPFNPSPNPPPPYGAPPPPPPGGPWGGAPGGYPAYPPPPPPPRKSSRALPVILGLILLMCAGMMAMLFFGAFLVRGAGGGFARGMNLGGHTIAMVRIEGPIMPGPHYEFWMKTLRAFEEDDSVKGIILRLDSPGGAVGASQEIYDEIQTLRKGKKGTPGKTVYASACDKIYANRGTLTGSIGVISSQYNVEGLAEKTGIKMQVIKSGRFKDAGSMFRPMTPEEQKVFDVMIGDAYQQFVTDVLAGREDIIEEAAKKLSEEDWTAFQFTKPGEVTARSFLLQVADGRVYTGAQAIRLGLVDELGALNHVIKALAKDLGVAPPSAVYEPQLRQGLMDLLSSKVNDNLPAAMSHSTLEYRMSP